MPSAATGFFGQLLGGLGEGLAARRKQQHDDQLEKSKQVTEVLLRNMGTGEGQIKPEHGLPMIAEILSGHYTASKGDQKGKGGKGKGGAAGSNPLDMLLGDPQNLGAGLTSFAQASGIFNTAEDVEKKRETAKTFDTNEQIRAYEAEDRNATQRNRITWTPGTTKGSDIGNETDFQGAPIDPEKTYKVGTKGDGTKQYVPVVNTQRPPALRDDQKRGAALADAAGLNWDTLSDTEKQRFTTLGAKAINSERTTRLAESTAMRMDRLALDSERLAEMKEFRPWTLAAKQAGVEVGTVKADEAGKVDPVKIRQQAVKFAEAVEQKKGLFSKATTALGLPGTVSKDELIQNYISENGAPATGKPTPAEAAKALRDHNVPVTPTNLQHYIDNPPPAGP